MKYCESCGVEYDGDELFCSKCGGKLVERNNEFGNCRYCGHPLVNAQGLCANCNSPYKCRKCGGKLVNEHEREKGVCTSCEASQAPKMNTPKPIKYKTRLTIIEILNYVLSGFLLILSPVALVTHPSMALIYVLVAIVFVFNGTVYGAIREILNHLK